MNVSSATTNTTLPDFQAGANRFKQSMDKLSSALDSGDVSAAKSAISSLKPQNAPSDTPPGGDDNPIAKAFNSISSSLDKGDISSAKETFTALKSSMSKMHGPPPPMQTSDANGSSTDSSNSTDGNGTNLNVTA